MSMTDPIADMFTRIRNAQASAKPTVRMPASKLKLAIVKLLKDEGYVRDFQVAKLENNKSELEIALKYFEGRPAIERLDRVSRSGLRVYRKFALGRHKLREATMRGDVPGLRKASW